jgi:ribosomal-protein-alanine N-acetyltransferase
VAEDNFAARRLYAGLGFEPVGKRGNYYARGSLGSVAAILMARAL